MDSSFSDLLVRLDRLSSLSPDARQKFRLAVSIADVDAGMSLTRTRTILEHVVHHVHRQKINEPGTRPLEELLQNIVKKGEFPRRLEAYALTVKQLGNIGAHGVGERIDKADVARSLDSLLPILEWFAKEYPSTAPVPEPQPQPTPVPPIQVEAPSKVVRRSGQFKTVQNVQAPRQSVATPPPIRPSASSSGMQPVVTLPKPKVRDQSALRMNVIWGAIGATAGAAIGANLGGIVGACLLVLGTREQRGIVRVQTENTQVMVVSALVLAFMGAIGGSALAALGNLRRPRRAEAMRSILAGTVIGWLLLKTFFGVVGVLFNSTGSSYVSDFNWLAIVGGAVGAVAGARSTFSWWLAVPRGLIGAAAGAIVLTVDLLLLNPSGGGRMDLAAALFYGLILGAPVGALSEFLAAIVSRGNRGERGFWLLVALSVVVALETVSGVLAVPAAVTIFALIGGVVGYIVSTSQDRQATGTEL
jgi:hypothetical protein